MAGLEQKADAPSISHSDSTPTIPFEKRQTPQSKWCQGTWLQCLTAYRVLVGLTFVVNLAILAAWLVSELHTSNATDPPLSGLLAATSTNLFVAVLIRQEDLINASFSLVAKMPVTMPFRVRKLVADFHHYGGLHVGCAVSALSWYCVFVALNTINAIRIVDRGEMNGWLWADIVICYVFLTFILFICVTALPRLRVDFHNTFEYTHRFGGWASLLVLWINTGVGTRTQTTNHKLYQSVSIWLLAATNFLVILPWLRICRVPIRTKQVSSREVMITFPYANVPYMSTIRCSLNPLKEWHAFATIPSTDAFTAHMIISQAGDWTKAIIQNPPQKIWIRKPAAANFLVFTPLFSSVALIATGAGIGPMLSLLSSPTITAMKQRGCKVRVMWCVYDPNAPHWEFAQKIIRAVDARPKIFDSKEARPDLAFEAQDLKRVEGIEAVMVVSNEAVTNNVVREIKAHGGAAYGAVFDS